ncbi:MAG TPA: PKD domain-containing protein [Aquaticitalea sp.]|nr:PKD domain-containing protein [Aquaticitalea sp.]
MKKLWKPTLIAICYLLVQSCGDDDFPVPPASTVPQFEYTIDNDEFAPATVTFTNTSIVPATVGTASFSWNFGDGQSSTEESPSHLYEDPGAYAVNLVVTTSGSLEIREITKTIVIKDPNATGLAIYYTDGAQVYEALINTQAPIFTQVAGISAQGSYGMVMDTLNLKLYISDYGGNKIYRSNLDGSNFEDFRTGIDQPNGMAIDYLENQIYWDTTTGIQRADMDIADVSQKEDFVTGQPNDPDGLDIDLVNRKLYWINYNGGVWSKNLDGTGETSLLPSVEGGSIKIIDNRIFYDEYVGSGDIRLKSANLDGSGISTVAVGIGRVVYGLAYDAENQKIYWGDRDTDQMMRANLDGTSPEVFYIANGDTRGIVIGK